MSDFEVVDKIIDAYPKLVRALCDIQIIAAREWAAEETNYEWYGEIASIAERVLDEL